MAARRVELFFQEGTSDKVYEAEVVADGDGTWTVKVAWGRRGWPSPDRRAGRPRPAGPRP
jgi:hypothetical protein